MMDIVSQMILKWDRLGPDNEILCSDDFTISLSLNKIYNLQQSLTLLAQIGVRYDCTLCLQL